MVTVMAMKMLALNSTVVVVVVVVVGERLVAMALSSRDISCPVRLAVMAPD